MRTPVSEGARRLIALAVVALAVVAQSVVTDGVGADRARAASDYGVRLLGADLSAPVSPIGSRPSALPPQVAEPPGSAATLFAPSAISPSPDRATRRGQRRYGIRGSDLRRPSVTLPELSRPFPNRDAAGALIEVTENDVLIPARLPY